MKTSKIFVFSNLATTVDGKIGTAKRGLFLLGSPRDRKQMQVLRKRSDAVLMGAGTLRSFRRPCRIRNAKTQPANVIVSRNLEGISPNWPFFKTTDQKRILLVTGKVPASRARAFERSSELVSVGPQASSWIRELSKRGIRRLLVEGGGGVMWDFAAENLIDEYHVTLVPRILGGSTAPTMVDGKGFPQEHCLDLELKKCKRIGAELFLTYVPTR